MRVSFIKMHGLGNDFVVLDAREQALPDLTDEIIRRLADRHEGIGCDQLILLERARDAGVEVGMRIFNQDGGEVGACGNASRAVALLLGEPARVATGGGIISVSPEDDGATVDMGMPRFDWQAIPLAYAMDTSAMPVGWEDLETPAAVNVGNPHVVFFVSDCDAVDLARIGPVIETDPLFPERINVNVATVTEHGAIRLRVWERGAGITRACGTGACATAVAAMLRGLASRSVEVALPGGTLTIAWDGETGIKMSGPATESFRGEFEWDQYA